ncbi:hypothetical protein SAMN05443999_1178 [Roseovarius azorensis]|uniref:Uncharacterized protein n=1 Tax=Roseovarius azorensis TaxID=1287727 RepID=A0A1H7WTN2_9RHOB|nr:hypothetical protein [Roseovarius azorensis]SEM24863.1 hypothetical protein SAMN05443999_1178 [Roseovarius azorensis]
MIAEISRQDVITQCRSALGIEPHNAAVDDAFLAALLRRTAGMLCPCSRTALRAAIVESLSSLHDLDDLPSRIEELTDELIVVGDLLELTDVTTAETDAKGTWVFAAPPAFVERKSGSVFLTGIVPDHDSVLPESLGSRVVYSRNTRYIEPQSEEDLAELLASEGLARLPENAWLKAPKTQTASANLEKAMQRLVSEPTCAQITGLEIIDPETRPTYYRGRWTAPKSQSGTYVSRRPQEFGAPIWCFAELQAGLLVRIIDLPLGTYRWRACDAAWHLQMAIDQENGRPQRYRITDLGNICRLDFFSPLPLWAERRLLVLGEKRPGEKSLFAFEIPTAEIREEEDFLQTNLWLVREDDTGEGRSA